MRLRDRDLTHAFEPGIPRWRGFPDEKRETIYWYEKGRGTKGEGFFSEVFCLVGQWGTHVDPPAHFARGGRTVDQITLQEMVLPLVVIDVHTEVAKDPDYTLTLERVKKWEADHGQVSAKSFVAMRTDWSKRGLMLNAMANKERKILRIIRVESASVKVPLRRTKDYASGHETPDTDPGIATSKNDYCWRITS